MLGGVFSLAFLAFPDRVEGRLWREVILVPGAVEQPFSAVGSQFPVRRCGPRCGVLGRGRLSYIRSSWQLSVPGSQLEIRVNP
jgi:hypothetical protein